MWCIIFDTFGHGGGQQAKDPAGLLLSLAEPVRDALMKLDRGDRRAVGTDVKDVEFAWPIGMPLCRKVGGLWEVRSSLSGGRIYRVLFNVDGKIMVLLHGFMKKTQKTPKKDIDTAEARWKDYKAQQSKHG